MYDLQAMFMASQVALHNTCESIPFMKMQELRMVVNTTGFTVQTFDNSYPIAYESIDWNQGIQNGTYDMATQIVKYLNSYHS